MHPMTILLVFICYVSLFILPTGLKASPILPANPILTSNMDTPFPILNSSSRVRDDISPSLPLAYPTAKDLPGLEASSPVARSEGYLNFQDPTRPESNLPDIDFEATQQPNSNRHPSGLDGGGFEKQKMTTALRTSKLFSAPFYRAGHFLISFSTPTLNTNPSGRVDQTITPPILLSPRPTLASNSANLFVLCISHVEQPSKILFQTLPGAPFLSSAVGKDSLTPGNGEYRIQQNNTRFTTHQTLELAFEIAAGDTSSLDGSISSQERLVLSGTLYRPQERKPSDREVELQYFIEFSENHSNELTIHAKLMPASPSSSATIAAAAYDRLFLTYSIGPEEEVFGLGEQFSFWSLKGQFVPILTREQGVGRGIQPITYILNHMPAKNPSYAGGDSLSTYSAIGHYITSEGRSLLLHNTELSFFNFTEKQRASIQVVSRSMRLALFYGRRPLDLLQSYTEHHSGRMADLPDWATGTKGAVVGLQGGEDKVIRVIETLLDWGVRVAAVWLQDWVGMREQFLDLNFPIPFVIPGFPSRTTATLGIRSTAPQKRLWWNWEYDRHRYPHWPEFVKRLREEFDVRVLTYINPFLADVETGKKPDGSWSVNYFKMASDRGFLVKRWARKSTDQDHLHGAEKSAFGKTKGKVEETTAELELVDYLISSGPGLHAGMIDLTNPAAYQWYKSLIRENMIKHGVSGWMADFGEYLPFDSVLFAQQNTTVSRSLNGTIEDDPYSPQRFHNMYPAIWAKLNREAIDEMGPEWSNELVFYSRSLSVQSPHFSKSIWVGDQLHTWDHLDGLESTIYAALSTSLSGFAYSHSDIGGYTTINVDPRVSIKVGNRTSYIRLPFLARRARLLRDNRELFGRWMEVAAFTSTAMFRTHEGSVPDENLHVWSDPEIATMFGYFTNMFSSLQSYRHRLSEDYKRQGTPLIRPMFLHYPHGNKAAVQMERLQFLLGPLLMVVPMTAPGLLSIGQRILDLPVDDDPDRFFDEESADRIMKEERQLSRSLSAAELRNGMEASGLQEYNAEEDLKNRKGSIDSELEADEDFSQSDLHLAESVRTTHPRNGRIVKRHVMRHVKGWMEAGAHRAVQWVTHWIQPGPTHDDMLPGESLSHPSRRSVRNVTSAPTQLPEPHHGRPYLPPGQWIHVWTGQRLNVTDPRGVWLNETHVMGKLASPVGQPAVFMRVMDTESMQVLLKQGLAFEMGGVPPLGGEDWRYWLQHDESEEYDQTFEQKVTKAMQMYEQLVSSLQPFLLFAREHAKGIPVPCRADNSRRENRGQK